MASMRASLAVMAAVAALAAANASAAVVMLTGIGMRDELDERRCLDERRKYGLLMNWRHTRNHDSDENATLTMMIHTPTSILSKTRKTVPIQNGANHGPPQQRMRVWMNW
jgi:hypothetical protein